ncbi:hypothetical protein O181_024066 [Austropuccinia psidii MF-1]|uniref:Uncharacterized protein n=1 Tax=Austropuccinia psidii MF-1 TaxID=1389203 RepID=A0A9Q3CFZ0_9BASI|nr:hypothetical protein [Austropuccinia psidii MF-1]
MIFPSHLLCYIIIKPHPFYSFSISQGPGNVVVEPEPHNYPKILLPSPGLPSRDQIDTDLPDLDCGRPNLKPTPAPPNSVPRDHMGLWDLDSLIHFASPPSHFSPGWP